MHTNKTVCLSSHQHQHQHQQHHKQQQHHHHHHHHHLVLRDSVLMNFRFSSHSMKHFQIHNEWSQWWLKQHLWTLLHHEANPLLQLSVQSPLHLRVLQLFTSKCVDFFFDIKSHSSHSLDHAADPLELLEKKCTSLSLSYTFIFSFSIGVCDCVW
jgi:hypothetical protein